MRILVTGATGFAGSWLVDALLAVNAGDVLALGRQAECPTNLKHIQSQIEYRSCDLCDLSRLDSILLETRPQQIYHLAGFAATGRSFNEPDNAWAGNCTATRNLLKGVAQLDDLPRILSVSSGLIYGDPSSPDQAVNEEMPFKPCSPYATSKAAADLLSYEYTRTHQLDIVRARPFNHIGPRQSPQFALASFSRQLAAISAGQQEPVLETGDLSAHRDMADVRDVVQAYIALMNKGKTGEAYNVASGETHTIQSLLDRLIQLASIDVEIRQKEHLLRVADTPRMLVDVSKLKQTTHWQPAYTLDQTLQDTLDYWRNQL